MQSLKPIGQRLACVALLSVMAGGCAHFQKQPTTTVRIHEQEDNSLPEGRTMPVVLPDVGLKLSISPFAALSERDVQSAEIAQTAGGAAILLRFGIHGTMALDEITTRCRGKYLVVVLNGRPVTAWLVDKRITTGQFLLIGDFTDAEAQKAVDELNQLAAQSK